MFSVSMSVKLSTLLVLLCLGLSVNCTNFPPPIEKCHFADENCMIEQAQKFLQNYPKDSKELGIPGFEPNHFEKLDILGDEKSAANINLYLTDVNFHNYSKMEFKKIRGFSKDTTKPMKIAVNINIPVFTLKSKYRITGKILILPITGEGDLEWTLTNLKAKMQITAKPEERNGMIYLKIIEYTLKSKAENVKIYMANLFNGDKALSENMLKLLNDNWKTLSDELQPQFDEALRKKNLAVLQKLLEPIPYEDYFLPDQ